MSDGDLRDRAARICGLPANAEGHHAGDPDCICSKLLPILRVAERWELFCHYKLAAAWTADGSQLKVGREETFAMDVDPDAALDAVVAKMRVRLSKAN